MERLTFDGNFCDIAMCRELPCQHGNNCTQKQVWERLKQYEDTELTPEDLKAPLTWVTITNMVAKLVLGVDPMRLRELAEADKAGRVVVLPCKVGDTVYRLVLDAEPHITRDEVKNLCFADDMSLCVELVGGRIILSEKFGKTVFLTREEAEAALKGEKYGRG